MDTGGDVRTHFKTPEGRYTLHSAKTAGTVQFQMRRPGTRLTVAALHGGAEEGLYMAFNVGELLHVTPFDATDKVWALVLCVAVFVRVRACTHAAGGGGSGRLPLFASAAADDDDDD